MPAALFPVMCCAAAAGVVQHLADGKAEAEKPLADVSAWRPFALHPLLERALALQVWLSEGTYENS